MEPQRGDIQQLTAAINRLAAALETMIRLEEEQRKQ